MTEVEFTGQMSRRRFRYDFMKPLPSAGRWEGPGTPTMYGHYRGVDVDSGQAVYIRAVRDSSPEDADTVRRVRHAIKVARTPTVRGCPTIVQLLDYRDEVVPVAREWGGAYNSVSCAWEWGDRVLFDELSERQYGAAELVAAVEDGVGRALTCLHAAGLVHSDVAPNNIVRIDGMWKLADLDNSVGEDEPITGLPRPGSPYRLEGINLGDPARREMDEYGLRTILDRIRNPPGR